jgi:hypothetical protein
MVEDVLFDRCILFVIQWEDQHEGLTCEEYEQWKIDNDPENQAMGLAAHLATNGIGRFSYRQCNEIYNYRYILLQPNLIISGLRKNSKCLRI